MPLGCIISGSFCLLTIRRMITDPPHSSIRLLIHGGAGAISRNKLTAEREQAYRNVLKEALLVGHTVLAAGDSSVNAVVAAIAVMEDSPLFNAGKGAVFTHDGRNEMDAAIMDGNTRKAGAVASVTIIRNPIRAAHAVMSSSPHVMLIGQGAEAFAKKCALEIVDPAYFYTQHRWNQLQKALAKEQILLDHDSDPDHLPPNETKKYGTVGAVALDAQGNLAAGTSTGGLTNKRYGRVGDSPIIGAGTYADNQSVAVSATGTGEMFIRTCAAFGIAAQVRWQQLSIDEAASHALTDVAAIGGSGGFIVLDTKGNYAMPFNTSGMFRGTIGHDGIAWTGIFSDN